MKIFETKLFDEFKTFFEKSKKICVIGHKNPDGDCIGSLMALKNFIEKLGKQVYAIVPDSIPDYFDWLEGYDEILVYQNNIKQTIKIIEDADMIFLVDFNSLKRVEDLAKIVINSNAVKVTLDHHRDPEYFTPYVFVDIQYSSAAQVVYDFMKKIDKALIDKQIAEYVFTGISSDTGNFMFDSVDASTFEAASELLKYEIDRSKIMKGLYSNYSFYRYKLLGEVLLNYTFFIPEKNTAYAYLTKKVRNTYYYKKGDHENFVNILLNIKGVEFSAFFFENDEEIRVSLRSIDKFDVNKVAKFFYEGGGHINAAGGKFRGTIAECLAHFEDNIDKMIEIAKS